MDKSSKIILGSIWAMFVIAVGLFVASTTYVGAPPTPLSSFATQPTLSLSAAECRNPSAAKDCLIFYSGGGLRIYSDRGGSQKVLISGDTGNVSISGTMSIAGTPVAAFATPQILYETSPVKEVCRTVNITGTTAVTFTGITTPQAVGPITLNNSGIGNADLTTFTNTVGIVTINGYSVVAGTPVAVTTPVSVDVCVKGN